MRKKLLLLLALSTPAFAANQYYSGFLLTQNPITQQGSGTPWVNGAATGLDWGNCATNGALVFGTIISGAPPYNDSSCILSGSWNQNQSVEATVHLANGSDSASQEEVELRLNMSISAHSQTGYEFDASVINGNPYLLIVRWNGPLNNYTVLTSNALVAVHDGDVLKATNVGGVLTFYLNGVSERTVTDSTYKAGSPGVGFWQFGGSTSELSHYGFTKVAATDSGGPINELSSCALSTVQSALTAISTDNTLITLPACTTTWTGNVSVTTSHTFSLMGQSVATGYNAAGNPTGFNDATKITDGNASGSNPYFTANASGSTGQEMRVSGISWQMVAQQFNGDVVFGGTAGAQFRFDHNHFPTEPNGVLAMATYEPVTGVLDHNRYDIPGGDVNNQIRIYDTGNGGNGDFAWTQPPQLGTSNEIYIENNYFTNGFINDCLLGGRYVVRFNTYDVTQVGGNIGIQSHAMGSQTRARGCRAWEVYENVIGNGGGTITNSAEFQTSGTGIVWGNNVLNSKHDVDFNSDRETNSTYTQSTPPSGWGYCGTLQTGSVSNWDQNTSSSGYACMDNPGRGQGDMISGTFPNVQNNTNPGVFTGSWPHQISQPVYIAMETCACSSTPFFATSPQNDLITNRDWYEPNGSFTGVTGTGFGTLASRPSTCTVGVGYWATDQGTWNNSGNGIKGQLYECSSTNVWSLYYTPYTYPHPLVGNTPTPVTTPPTNVQATVFIGNVVLK